MASITITVPDEKVQALNAAIKGVQKLKEIKNGRSNYYNNSTYW